MSWAPRCIQGKLELPGNVVPKLELGNEEKLFIFS